MDFYYEKIFFDTKTAPLGTLFEGDDTRIILLKLVLLFTESEGKSFSACL